MKNKLIKKQPVIFVDYNFLPLWNVVHKQKNQERKWWMAFGIVMVYNKDFI